MKIRLERIAINNFCTRLTAFAEVVLALVGNDTQSPVPAGSRRTGVAGGGLGETLQRAGGRGEGGRGEPELLTTSVTHVSYQAVTPGRDWF